VELRTGIVKDVYRVSAANRYALVDSMTQVISNRMRLSSPSGSIADATTKSLVAYRFYEEGLRAYHQGDLPAARRLMRTAVAEDTSFAIAAWYEALLSSSAGVTLDGRHITEARQRALFLAQRAPERERLLITASILGQNNDPRLRQAAESLNTRFPDDPRALMILAGARGGAADWAGAVAALERAITLDSMAEVDETSICRVCDHFYRLAEIYDSWDSLAAVQRTARRFQAIRPKHGASHVWLAVAGARLGDTSSAYASYRRSAAGGTESPHFKLSLDVSLEEYDVVERDVRRLLASSSLSDWGNGAWAYFIALRAQGRLREATLLSRNGWFPGLPPLRVAARPSEFLIGIAALETGDAADAVQVFQRLPITQDAGLWAPGVVARNRSWKGTLTGMALAAAGDTARLRVMADSVERWGGASAYGRDQKSHYYLRGMLDVAAGRDEDAIRNFRQAIYSTSLGFTRVNFELARALLRLGRPQDAVAVLQPALRGPSDASNLYISRTELHELLADAFDRAGMADSAAVHYRAVVRAWQRADPQFHGRRNRAATWLTRNPRGPITDR
jgi:tetratricopeptide (TPR) repeat protein